MALLLALLLLGATLREPVSPETWPLDTYVAAKIDSVTIVYEGQRWQLTREAVAHEQHTLQEAEQAVIGVVRSFSEMTGPDGVLWSGTDVAIEQQIIGEWPDSIITFYRPRGSLSTGREKRCTRAEDGSLPEVGKRYLFIGTKFLSEPWVLRGGNRLHRYLIEDELVASKGLPLDEFLEHIEAFLFHIGARPDTAAGSAEPAEVTADDLQPPN